MMASDAQKHYTLQYKRGLITTGWFSRVRHPNYLGEMMLYASFAVVAGHVLPWLVLACGSGSGCSCPTCWARRPA